VGGLVFVNGQSGERKFLRARGLNPTPGHWAVPLVGVVIAVLLVLCGCRPQVATISGETQGTTYHITIADPADAGLLRLQLERRLREIDHALSNYRSDSELTRFNRAPVGEWMTLGADLYHVLKTSQRISAESDGAFDITVAPLLEVWGFGPGRGEYFPSPDKIDAARRRVGYRFLELDSDTPRARKLRELEIDVNGIAQGYTVDALAGLLRRAGYRNFLVEVGGELRLSGHSPRGTAWRVAIEKPSDKPGEVQQGITGSDIGITTAGDYHDYFERDGKRYSHTIDPATGRPVEHTLASVTVIAASAEYADGMDTALEVLGPERGYRLAERLGLAAFFIVREGDTFRTFHTSAFAPYRVR